MHYIYTISRLVAITQIKILISTIPHSIINQIFSAGQPNGKALQTLTPRNGLPQQQGGKGHMSRSSVLAPVKANGVQRVIPRSRQLGTSQAGSLAGSGVVRSGVPGTGSRALSDTANTTGVPRYIAHADPSDRPFQHPSLTDEEVVKVDIHGHPRGKDILGYPRGK